MVDEVTPVGVQDAHSEFGGGKGIDGAETTEDMHDLALMPLTLRSYRYMRAPTSSIVPGPEFVLPTGFA